MKVVITGGHHSSALPVIKELRDRIPDVEILWMGHKHSMKNDVNPTLEYLEITKLGIPFFNLKAGKLYKTYDIKRLLKIPFGFFQALIFLLRNRPNIIVSFGGYLAAPVVIAGYFLGIPSITHEQTAVAGYSNRLISKFVKVVMISWKKSEKYFPKNKTVFTGIPLREEIFTVKSNSFHINENLPTIYISAGKTGSHLINNVIRDSLESLLSFCNVVHQCGDNSVYNDFGILESRYEDIQKKSKGNYYLRKFVFDDEIGEAYSKADLVVSRSGAHTISEIISLEKPAILIPIPWVSHNEQFVNADMVREAGLAEIIEQKNLIPSLLVEKIKHCLSNISLYKLKNKEDFKFLKKNSAGLIVDEIIKFSKK